MWLSLWLSVLLAISSPSTGCCDQLTLTPVDLNAVTGKSISVNCNISSKLLRSQYNASSLVFSFEFTDPSSESSPTSKDKDCDYPSEESASDEVDWEDDFPVPCNTTGGDSSNCSEELSDWEENYNASLKVEQSYVRVIDQYVSRLEYPGLSNRFNFGRLACCIDGKDKLCKRAHILVGERPHVPIIKNVKAKNWNKFEFHWKTKEKNAVYNTKYLAWYRRSSTEDFLKCPLVEEKKCIKPDCVVNFNLTLHRDLSAPSRMFFKVNASNAVGTATSPVEEVDLYDIVTPDPVHVINVTIGNSSTCVKFKSPKFLAELNYKVFFRCPEQSQIVVKHPKSVDEYLEACTSDAPSYANCTVSVRAKPSSYGQWSELSPQTRFTTPQRVPLASPEVCQSCFEILSTNDDKSTFDTLIFPKPLSRAAARGRVVTYRASLTMHDGQQTPVTRSIVFNANNSGLNFTGLDPTSSYDVTVVAATEAGYNESIIVSPLIINPTTAKKLRAWPRNITAFIIDSATIRLSWLCEHPGLRGFTVFWCRVATLNQCKDPLEYSHVPSNVTRFDITNLPAFDLLNYLFGVAVETADGNSSGVVWTKCLYNLSRVSSPPLIESKLNGMKVRLNFSKDVECNAGFPYAYRVEYCPMPANASRCHSGSATELIVDDDTYEFNHLASNTKYLFIVSSLSVAGPSLRNSTIHLTIPSEAGSNRYIIAIVIIVVGIVLSVFVLLAVNRQRIRDCTTIGILPPTVVQRNDFHEDSSLYPDYAHIHEEPSGTSRDDVHENGRPSMNSWSPALDSSSSSSHLIPKSPHIAPDLPPYREGSRITENKEEEDDNVSIASVGYAQGKLRDKPDVVPSSSPVTPIFPFEGSDSPFPNSFSLALPCGDNNEPRDAPETPQLLAVVIDGVSDSNNSSSCGYAVGHHGDNSWSTADDFSLKIPEDESDALKVCLPMDSLAVDLVDVVQNIHPRSLAPNEAPDNGIRNNDIASDLLDDTCSVVEVHSPPEGSRSDDDEDDSSILSSSDYALANFHNKRYESWQDTPAVDINCQTIDDDSDSNADEYASVSLLHNKLADGSMDSLSRTLDIPSNSVHDSALSS